MSRSRQPTLLVATEFAPNASGGGPAVIRQMLKDWAPERLLWWSCTPDQDQRFGQAVTDHRVAHLPRKLRPLRRLARQKACILDWIWVPYATLHLKRMLSECKPDAIWGIPHNWSITPLASALANANIKYHVTVQDYVDAHGQAEKFGRHRCLRMADESDQLYAGATTRDATSHPMIADLEQRTGRTAAQMLHAGLEPADFHWLNRKEFAPNSEIRIAHAGTILVDDVFAHFVTALDRVRMNLGAPVRIDLFGAHSYSNRPWFDREWMVEHGNLDEITLLNHLRQCTWGFAPMSLTDNDPRYNRFSFPTKFITYLAAGLPVITVAHPDSSITKMAQQYHVGLLETDTDLDSLAAKLQQNLNIGTPLERFKSEILRCAAAEFDAVKMRARLYDCFETCASLNQREVTC